MDSGARMVPLALDDDPIERSRAEVDTAIRMVVDGYAHSVRLACLAGAEDAAPVAAASAQANGLLFRMERGDTGSVTLIVGPTILIEVDRRIALER